MEQSYRTQLIHRLLTVMMWVTIWTLTVTDDGGKTDTCTATVTVQDNKIQLRTAKTSPFNSMLRVIAIITPADIDNRSFDTCSNT